MTDEESRVDGEEPKAPTKPARRRRLRWPYVLGVCVVAVVLLVVLLPTILSLGPARRLILSRVNSRLRGSVEMASWSLGWFSGFDLEGLKLKDAEGRTVLGVQAVHVSASVPMLLGSRKDLGTVEVVSPSIDIVREGAVAPGPAGVPAAGGPPAEAAPAPAKRLPFDLKGHVLVKDGRVSVTFADAEPLEVSGLSADVRIDGLEQPISYEAEAAVGKGGGRLSLSGSARVASDGVVSLDRLDASSEITLQGFRLSDVSPIARQLGMPVDVGGLVAGRLAAQVQGQSAKANGQVHVSGLSMAGGPLGTDRPELEQVDVSFDLEASGGSITVRELQVVSPVARAELSGSLSKLPQGKLPTGTLNATAFVELGPLANLLPDTLRLRKGLVVKGGTCSLGAAVESDGETARLTGDFRMADLVAVLDGQEIRPQAPLSARLEAEVGPAGPQVGLLELNSSFATAKGSGTLDRFALDASVDLAAAMKEAAGFLDVGQWQMAGTANAHVAIRPSETGLPAERLIDGTLAVKDLRVGSGDKVLVSEDAMSASVSALATLDERGIPRQLANVRADLAGSFGQASLGIGQIAHPGALEALVVSDAKLTGRADLSRLFAVVRCLGLAPAGVDVQGAATVALAGELSEGTFDVSGFTAETEALSVTSGGRVLFGSDVRAEGAGQADLGARQLRVSRATLETADARAAVDDLLLPDWSRLPEGVTGKLSGSLDLAGLPALLGEGAGASTRLRTAGTAQFELDISAPDRADDQMLRAVSAKAVLEDVAVTGLTERPILEESATAVFSGLVGPQEGGSAWSLRDGAASVRSSLFSSELKAPRALFGGPGGLEVAATQLTASAELGPLADLARRLGLLPEGLDVAGSAEVSGAASMQEGRLDLTGLEGRIRELAVTRGGKTIREPEIRMAAQARVSLAERSIACPSASLKLSSGTVTARDVAVADWADLTREVAGNLRADLDVAGLLKAAADYVPLPDDVSPSGKLDVEVAVARREGGWDANLRATADDLKIARGNAPAVAVGKVELLAAGTVAAAGPTVTFDPLRLSSDLFGVDGRLVVSGSPPKRRLEAEGSLQVDFGRIGSLVSAVTGHNIELAGRDSKPFHVVAELGGGDWRHVLRNMQADAGIALERVAFGGMRAEGVAVKLGAKDGRASAEITGSVNEGELRLPLTVDLTTQPLVLIVPPGSQVLKHANLTDEMSDGILARVLPIFKGALKVKGNTSVDCEDFRVPLGPDMRRSIAVKAGLSFAEVSFTSAGLLNSLLSLVQLGERAARLPDQRVGIALRDGRVYQEQLELYVDKYLLLASGSVGLDKSLDFLMELPITAEIAGSGDAYKLLEGQTLKVRVTGTLDDPKIDRDIIGENLRSLIQEAGRRLLLDRAVQELTRRRSEH